MGVEIVKKVKLIALGVLVLLILIVVIQNSRPVETRFLWMKGSVSQTLLLLITVLLGFASGALGTLWYLRRK